MLFVIGELGTVPIREQNPGERGNQGESRNDPDDKIIEEYEGKCRIIEETCHLISIISY